MSANPLPNGSEAAARAAGQRALDHFLEAGFCRIEPPILQPAAVFLDMSGEEIRGRLYLTTDPSGEELCLGLITPSPSVSRISRPHAGERAIRLSRPGVSRPPGQLANDMQTGLESYGRRDVEAADAEILACALEAAAARAGALNVRHRRRGLFDGVIGALGLTEAWRRRARRGLAQGKALEAIDGAGRRLAKPGVLAALERADHAGAKALVKDLLAIAGIATVGGRDSAEIADRFLEQAAERAEAGLGASKQAILKRFLAISGDPDSGAASLRALASEAKLQISARVEFV